MSENGAVMDATRIYQYIRKFSGKSKVIVWGHSLGTAWVLKINRFKFYRSAWITFHVTKRMLQGGRQDGGAIVRSQTVTWSLDFGIAVQQYQRRVSKSSANSRKYVKQRFSMTVHWKARSNYIHASLNIWWCIPIQLYRPLSVVDRFFTERLPCNNVAFDSDVHIAGVECPTLILHARDDPIVPVFLTKKVCCVCTPIITTGTFHRYRKNAKNRFFPYLHVNSSTRRGWNPGLVNGLHYRSSNSTKTWNAPMNTFAEFLNCLPL